MIFDTFEAPKDLKTVIITPMEHSYLLYRQ